MFEFDVEQVFITMQYLYLLFIWFFVLFCFVFGFFAMLLTSENNSAGKCYF